MILAMYLLALMKKDNTYIPLIITCSIKTYGGNLYIIRILEKKSSKVTNFINSIPTREAIGNAAASALAY